MGHIRNHVILVSGPNLEKAHAKAREIFPWVSQVSPDTVNEIYAFFIPPDGSKEGWQESIVGDARREAFKKWLLSPAGKYLDWVELYFGGDDPAARITDES